MWPVAHLSEIAGLPIGTPILKTQVAAKCIVIQNQKRRSDEHKMLVAGGAPVLIVATPAVTRRPCLSRKIPVPKYRRMEGPRSEAAIR
jgi:hypothetical protein